ncbi:hypothetical protein V1264_024400 [Littorina saxatilis]|uniref:protein-tyrosine-phosphatase n=2 Tax=Littorina saxatilis TaxID=31220 RepID=A0AAN9AN21_9CAEN
MPLCQQVCRNGQYGVNCNKTCGQCANNDACNKTNGHCPGSCQGAFKPPLCDSVCDVGTYGKDCNRTCGQCGGDEVCDKDTGHCTACQSGWSPPLCQQECEAGRYGKDCNATCGHCKQNSTCCPDTGVCPHGCEEGFAENLCDKCHTSLWGANCSLHCGHCGNDGSCDMDTGLCLARQCSPGWNGTHCLQALPQSSAPSSPAVGVAVGVVVSLLLAAAVIGAVVFFRRRGGFKRESTRENNETEDFSGPRSQSESSGNSAENSNGKPKAAIKPRMKALGSARTEAADHANDLVEESAASSSADTHLYGNIPLTSSQAQKASIRSEKNGSSKAAGSASAKHGAKPAIAAKPKTNGPVYENVELGSMMKAEDLTGKNKIAAASPEVAAKPKIAAKGSGKDRPEDDDPEEKDVYSHEDLYACYSSVTPVSLLDKFQKYLLDCLASPYKVAAEFEKFPTGMPHAYTVGSDPANTKKNRFKKLCAYDKNRVLLNRPAGDTDTDYINATYIKGHNNEKAYIATQGPRSNTMGDLWWMIWQDDVTQIVMLTNLKEDGKDKCDEYWPAVGKTVAHGHVIVKATEEEERADFIIRTFILKVKGSPGKSREVQQYHYQAWPDHGVPAAGSLVNFWRYVTARAKTTAPPVVHCSAGVGRTGTYIALDIAMDRKSRGSDVSVKEIVTELREQRSIMVQTEVQYKFLHEVILEAYTSRDTRLTLQQLDDVFPADIDVTKPNKRIDQEFRLLKEIKRWAKPHHTNAELEENKHKNRDPRVLPDDDHLAYLNVYVRGRNQYISAVFMSWFKVRKGLLLTQLPLPDTMVDLWRLVEGCGVNTILSLGGQQDHTAVPNYCQYWPQTLDEVLTIGPYRVTLTNAANLGGSLKSFTMDFKTKDNSRQVRVLRFTAWSGELPSNTSELLQLVDTLNTATEDDTSPVVIQCLDGATRSGLFSVLFDVISRMTYDGDVDVFPTVRYANSVRPEAVTSEEQYRYCYKVAQEFKRTLSVYANT